MNDPVESLKTLIQEQREIISELENENRSLRSQAQTSSVRIRELEQQRVAIDREVAEIPIGFKLIPEDDLNKN